MTFARPKDRTKLDGNYTHLCRAARAVLADQVIPEPRSSPNDVPRIAEMLNLLARPADSKESQSPQPRAVRKMGKDTATETKRPAADRKLDEQKVIALTEYVQKLGSVERAKQALDALEQLRRAA